MQRFTKKAGKKAAPKPFLRPTLKKRSQGRTEDAPGFSTAQLKAALVELSAAVADKHQTEERLDATSMYSTKYIETYVHSCSLIS